MNGNTESIDVWLRPRGAQAHKRPRHHRSFGPAFAEAAPSAPSRDARPPLGMPEPDSTRHTVVSGSISLAAHGAVVASLAMLSLLQTHGAFRQARSTMDEWLGVTGAATRRRR